MVAVKSPVPGLSRGIEILRLLAAPMTVEEIVRRTGFPKSSVLRILETLRSEGLIARDGQTRAYHCISLLVPNTTLTQIDIMPGDAHWHCSGGFWYWTFTRNAIPNITTYSAGGDSDTGIMWRVLPREGGFDLLKFSVHGGRGQVLLVQGDGTIPTDGDVVAIHRDLLAGLYGKVLAVVEGPGNNEREIRVAWDLSRAGDEEVKVVIIDSLREPWGFVSVSLMALVRS